jgi:asparagine synthase (glutamine-hydrolysing)
MNHISTDMHRGSPTKAIEGNVAQSKRDILRVLVSVQLCVLAILVGAAAVAQSTDVQPDACVTDPGCWTQFPDPAQRMMYLDAISYLPGDILTKVDMASMAVSLEARVPLLAHSVAEFAWRLPMHLKIRNAESKWILRRVLSPHLPQELIDRPKMGFSLSIGSWLQGALREWADHLLEEERLRAGGFLNPGPIREIWCQHLAGHRNWQERLWTVLMFQAWLEHWGG